MRGTILFMVLVGAVPVAVSAAQDGAVQRGGELHDSQCMECHGTEVYTRDDRRIGSRAGLRGQVARCTRAAGADWGDDEIAAVVRYLDQRFYQFDGEQGGSE